MKNLLANEEINKGRQKELDISKGLAVIFMIAVHVLEVFSVESCRESSGGFIVEFFGTGLAATVFMFLLGVGIIYSNNSEPKKLIKRGIVILLMGYVLNILRGSIPCIVENLIKGEAINTNIALYEFIKIDILQFAGLVFIFFGIIKYLNLSKKAIFILVILMVSMNLLVPHMIPNNIISKAFTGLIWGSSEISYFPFITWIIYPVAGYIWGGYLIRCINLKRFYKLNLFNSAWIFALSFYLVVIELKIDIGTVEAYGYYHHHILGSVVFLSLLIFWISIIYFMKKFIPKTLMNILERCSRNVTKIYFIHWCLIGWLTLFIEVNTQYGVSSVIIFIVIVVISYYLAAYAKGFNRIKK